MPSSIRIPLEEPSQAAEARRMVLRLADQIGLDETRSGQAAIVVMEASTNILKHARRGEILLQIAEPGGDGPLGLELIALDKGPGMRNIEQCLEDGYTTGSSPGTGLGAIRRLADESDFYSVPGEGTAVLARWNLHRSPRPFSIPALSVGFVNVSKPGEEICGDSFGVQQSGDEATVMLADGLGHGYEARKASLEAVRMLHEHPSLAPAQLIDMTHRALKSHRGAAVSIARLQPEVGKLQFSGLGNVAGQIYDGAGRSLHLVSVNGTAGHNAARIREFAYPWPKGGILVMHSDGLVTAASLDARPALARRDPSLIAGVLYRDFSRGHDDATVVIARAA